MEKSSGNWTSKRGRGRKKNNVNEKEEEASVSTKNETDVNDESEDSVNKKKLEESPNKKPKRRLHAVHKNAWSDDIAHKGYARCIIATCNFITSDFATMENHFKVCNGTPVYDENFCVECENYLSSGEELLKHKNLCKGWSDSNKKRILPGQIIGKKSKTKPKINNVETNSDSDEGKMGESSNDEVADFCPIYNKYISKDDIKSHLQICPAHENSSREAKEGNKNVHFKTIQLKMKQTSIDKDCIVQPGPDIPEGQYFRRRSYTKQHKNIWKSTLEKTKYVKCIFRNCYFIAMSLEDMISHFGYCIGDGSFAKFNCPYCNGRVTSAEILDLHVERSHSHERALYAMEDNEAGPEAYPKVEMGGIPEDYPKPDEVMEVHTEDYEENNVSNLKKIAVVDEAKPKSVKKEKCNEQEEENETPDDALRKTTWENDLIVFGMAICRKAQCNFATISLPDIIQHFKHCTGQPLNYPEGGNYVKPLSVQEQKKRLRMYTKQRMKDLRESQSNNSAAMDIDADLAREPVKVDTKKTAKTEKKGRASTKKTTESDIAAQKYAGVVECGKCGFRGKYKTYIDHNMRKHIGLGWIKGENPVDLTNEKEVESLLKEAFKLTKKGKCEICGDVKKSVKGFLTHTQMCGKSEEEKKALKSECPECSALILKYSMAKHMKMYHTPGKLDEKQKQKQKPQESFDPSGKRQSAISALSKFGDFINEYENEPQGGNYFFYQKKETKLPKLCYQLTNLWYKLQKEKKKIICRHPNCGVEHDDVKDARQHHFTCPKLPDKVYMCESCDFYSLDEPTMETHVSKHRNCIRQKRIEAEVIIKEEENGDDDMEGFDGLNDEGHSPAKKKKKYLNDSTKPNMDEELRMKQLFCRRQKMDNVRGLNFYCNGLEMTLSEELVEEENKETWPELQTKTEDWCQVPTDTSEKFFPELKESLSVNFTNKTRKDIKWRKIKRFEAEIIDDVPVMFAGGSVRSMSWCKVSSKRMKEKMTRQFLAVSTAKNFDYMTNIQEKSSPFKSTILQIWDCGCLENAPAKETPKLVLGILHDTGEIWDLSWFPEDTYFPETKNTLPRLGLLVTASEDGVVRIWSVCDPSHLKPSGLPIFKTNPTVKLVNDQDLEDNCLRVAVGKNGVIAGGYGNGVLAVWNVKNLASPFTKKEGNCSIIKAHLIIQAHRTSITALTFQPSCNRYISSGALDRVLKLWDLESPMLPVEQFTKETCLDNIWTRNWPMMIYNFDDVFIVGNKGFSKFVKNSLGDKSQSCLIMDNMCVNVSFSDWLNALCGCSNTGEVKVRLLKNFIYDQKIHEKTQTTISSVSLEKFNGGKAADTTDGKNNVNEDILFKEDVNKTYNRIISTYGLIINDNEEKSKTKVKKSQIHPDEFPMKAVNQVCFNPNFKSFAHIAVGYNCGLIRIQFLKELQNEKNIKTFLETETTDEQKE